MTNNRTDSRINSRTRKHTRKTIRTVIFTLLIITGVILCVGGLLALQSTKQNKPEGTWTREVSLRSMAIQNGNRWLAGAVMGDTVDMADYLEELTVLVTLTMDKKGNWQQQVDEESLAQAYDKAFNALADAFCDVMEARLTDQGLTESMDGQTVQEIVEAALGESITDYLRENGPVLLPEYEELRSLYGGEGTFTKEGDVLTRKGTISGVTQEVKESVLLGKDYLVFTAILQESEEEDLYPIMYRRQEADGSNE